MDTGKHEDDGPKRRWGRRRRGDGHEEPHPESTRSTRKKKRRRGPLRWILLGATTLVLLALLTLLLARFLWMTDERLRGIAVSWLGERLQTEVQLESLSIGIFDGVELRGFRIGPMKGFTRDTLAFDRMALHWSLGQLIHWRVKIDEVALEGVRVSVEENEHGKNLDAVRTALLPPQAASEQTPSEPAQTPEKKPEDELPPDTQPKEQKPLVQPELPIAVDLDRLAFSLAEVRVERPDLTLLLTHLGMEGSFHGEGTAMDLALWMGLGEREPKTTSSVVQFDRTEPKTHVTSAQRLGIKLASSGLSDVRIDMELQARTEVSTDRVLPPIEMAGELGLAVDVITGKIDIPMCSWRIGDTTWLELRAAVENAIHDPYLRLDSLALSSQLGPLTPLVAAFMPGTSLEGLVRMELEPLAAAANKLGNVEALDVGVVMRAEGVGVRMPGTEASGIDATVKARTSAGNARVEATMKLARAQTETQRVTGMALTATVTTPLGPWLPPKASAPTAAAPPAPTASTSGAAAPTTAPAPTPAPALAPTPTPTPTRARTISEPVRADMTLSLKSARAPQGSVDNLRMVVHATVPPKLVQKKRGSEPMHVAMQVDLGAADSPQGGVSKLKLDVDATTWDMMGHKLQTVMKMSIGRTSAPVGGEKVVLPPMSLTLDLGRNLDFFDIGTMDFALGDVMTAHLQGRVEAAMSPEPRLKAFQVVFGPVDLAKALALAPSSMLPPDMRGPQPVSGSMTMSFSMDGSVPYKQLQRELQPPVVTGSPEDESLPGRKAAAYDDYLLHVSRLFEQGLPFVANMGFSLEKLSLVKQGTAVSGVNTHMALELESHSVAFSGDLKVAEVVEPQPVRAVDLNWAIGMGESGLGFSSKGSVAHVQQPGQPRPFDGIGWDCWVKYAPHGDLTIDKIIFTLASHGVFMDASSLVSKPVRMVQSRSLSRPGLPGAEMAFKFSAGIDSEKPQELSPGGAILSGRIALDAAMELKNGLVTLIGAMKSNKLDVVSGANTVDDMSGELPFDVRLAFDKRSDGIVLARNVAMGGGVVTLLTADTDIRERPARPVYYDRLRPYRQSTGLSMAHIQSGPHEIKDFELEARFVQGMMLCDWISLNVLGGDVVGKMAVQLFSDASVRGDIGVKISNIDASYFPQLKLTPGPDSELSADMYMGFLFDARQQDLTVNMNVTKIGPETLDRFLQLLDPEGKDSNLQKQRKNMFLFKAGLLRLDEVAVWIRYGNLNMDLNATSFIRIPGTSISYLPIERELLRRFSLSEQLDKSLRPSLDKSLAATLGWSQATPQPPAQTPAPNTGGGGAVNAGQQPSMAP